MTGAAIGERGAVRPWRKRRGCSLAGARLIVRALHRGGCRALRVRLFLPPRSPIGTAKASG